MSQSQFVFFRVTDNPDLQIAEVQHATCYFYITAAPDWEDNWRLRGILKDELRTRDIKAVHPKFRGGDIMESVFEFSMNEDIARSHLLSLGMIDGDAVSQGLPSPAPQVVVEIGCGNDIRRQSINVQDCVTIYPPGDSYGVQIWWDDLRKELVLTSGRGRVLVSPQASNVIGIKILER